MQHHAGGLSILEILISVAIIGVLASTATLSFRGVLAGSRTAQAAERIAADIQQIQTTAVREQKSYKLLFNLSQCSYAAAGVQSALAGNTPLATSLAEFGFGAGDMVITPASCGSSGMVFDAYGQLTQEVTITLKQANRQAVVLIRTTGEVVVQK
jgi:Tfp pilus assembly protein FimT